MSSTTLERTTVEALFFACIFDSLRDVGRPLSVKGFMRKADFHEGRLDDRREEIVEALEALPRGFHDEARRCCGAGLDESDLFAEVGTTDMLIMLGIGIGRAKYCDLDAVQQGSRKLPSAVVLPA